LSKTNLFFLIFKRAQIGQEIMKKSINPSDYLQLIVAATILCNEQDFEAALRVLHDSDHLEW